MPTDPPVLPDPAHEGFQIGYPIPIEWPTPTARPAPAPDPREVDITPYLRQAARDLHERYVSTGGPAAQFLPRRGR